MAMRDQIAFDKIDLHLIRVLHTVLTERSVSRAALRLGMHQPRCSPTRAASSRRPPSMSSASPPATTSIHCSCPCWWRR